MAHSITKKVFGLLSAVVFLSFIFQSCSHLDEITNSAEESSPNEESHNAGKNCMSCHHDQSNEASSKWWYFAGTVYDGTSIAASSGFIELWTGANRSGLLLHKVPVDKAGNFYTEKIVDFKGGFYPVFVNNDQSVVKSMSSKTTEGSCSSCHGVSQSKISIN